MEIQTKEELKQSWLQGEVAELKKTQNFGEPLEALKLEENKEETVIIDFSKPFEKYIDEINNTTKKLIIVEHNQKKKIWWLNVRNPIYRQIMEAGLTGQKVFRVLRTGSQKNTKYLLLK